MKLPHVIVDSGNYRMIVRRRQVNVPPTEMKILKLLDQRRGNLVPHEDFAEIWSDYPGTDYKASVRVHVNHLRVKLGRDAGAIRTVNHLGYVLEA